MFSQRIKHLRLKQELTQKDLSDYLNVTPKTISFYELGQRMPPADVLIKLSHKFSVTVDYLLGLTDNPNNQTNTLINDFSKEELELFNMYHKLPENEAKHKIAMRIEIAYEDMLEKEKSKLDMREIS